MKRIVLWIAGIAVIAGLGAPLSAQALEPIYKTQFNEKTFFESGWSFFQSRADYEPASVSIGLIPTSPTSSGYSDGRGVVVTALSGQGSFIYGPVIPTSGNLVLLKISVLAMAKGGTIAAGALNAEPGGSIANVNGSVSYAYETDSGQFTSDYQYIQVLYRPQNGAIIPIFQLAVAPSSTQTAVTAMFDNFEVYVLDENSVADAGLRQALGIVSTSPGATPTPIKPTTPTPTSPHATPTITPTSTPTQSAPTPSGGVFTPDASYTLTTETDTKEAFNPNVAYDHNNIYAVVASDLIGGYQDINLRHIDIAKKTVSSPFAVNQGFQDTVAQTPDVDVDFSGTRHIVWSDNRSLEKLFSVYLAQVNSAGTRQVENDLELNSLYQNTNTAEPAVSVLDNGDLAVCWRDDRNYYMDTFVRRFHWTGTKVEALDAKDFQINIPYDNTNVSHPDIKLTDGGTIAAVWSDDRVLVDGKKRNDIYARIFKLTTAYTDTRQLPDTIVELQLTAVNNEKDNATTPQAAYQNGSFVVVWKNANAATSDSFIHAAVVNEQGKVVQSEFIVDSGASGLRSSAPSISAWKNNQFLIAWFDGASGKIVGRTYDAGQNLFTSDIFVLANNAVSTEQTGLAIGDSNRSFLVWDGVKNGYRDIYGASLSAGLLVGALSTPVSVGGQDGEFAPLSVATQSVEDGRLDNSCKPARETDMNSASR